MKKDRLAYKAKENAAKPSLVSDDVLETANFTFAKTMTEREGDSGQLLLAKRRTDHSEQYLVKHAFTDCAANEFVYTKLVQAMDYHMPDAKLFQLSPGEKRTCFKTEYIIGTKYLNVIDMCPDFDVIRSMAQNWQDFFGFRALYTMLLEGDGMEVLLADDGCIYRVDTSDAFTCNNRILDNAGVDRLIQGVNLNTAIKNMLFSKNYDRLWNNASFTTLRESHAASCALPRACLSESYLPSDIGGLRRTGKTAFPLRQLALSTLLRTCESDALPCKPFIFRTPFRLLPGSIFMRKMPLGLRFTRRLRTQAGRISYN